VVVVVVVVVVVQMMGIYWAAVPSSIQRNVVQYL
jgi:hypothetical protein